MEHIRPARQNDHPAIVELWHSGWHDAHATLVPEAILKFRKIKHFWIWLSESTDRFFVATHGDALSGFVATNGPELVKLYVAPGFRRTGIAAALLTYGEHEISRSGVRHAVLHCTAGNDRAKRFYHRHGWSLAETFDDALWLPKKERSAFAVKTHRFRKHLA